MAVHNQSFCNCIPTIQEKEEGKKNLTVADFRVIDSENRINIKRDEMKSHQCLKAVQELRQMVFRLLSGCHQKPTIEILLCFVSSLHLFNKLF